MENFKSRVQKIKVYTLGKVFAELRATKFPDDHTSLSIGRSVKFSGRPCIRVRHCPGDQIGGVLHAPGDQIGVRHSHGDQIEWDSFPCDHAGSGHSLLDDHVQEAHKFPGAHKKGGF